MKSIVILGAGGHGRVVADIAQASGFESVVFVDERWPSIQKNLHWEVVGKDFLTTDHPHPCFVAIGHNATRLEKLNTLFERKMLPTTLIHPSSVVSNYSFLNAGCVLMPQTVVNAGTQLGKGVILNSAASVDHDCKIGDCVHISPGARIAGGVTIGDCTWVGIGSSIVEGCYIGKNVIIAAGAVVVEDVADNCTVFGIPAKVRN